MREQTSGTTADEAPATNLARDLLLYTLARLGILVVSAGVLVLLHVPLLVAAAVAVVLVMPLSMLVFGSLRRRVATGLAQRSQRRQAQRERLRAQLRGADSAESGTGENYPNKNSTGENAAGDVVPSAEGTGEGASDGAASTAEAGDGQDGSGKDSTNQDESGATPAGGATSAAGGAADARSAGRSGVE